VWGYVVALWCKLITLPECQCYILAKWYELLFRKYFLLLDFIIVVSLAWEVLFVHNFAVLPGSWVAGTAYSFPALNIDHMVIRGDVEKKCNTYTPTHARTHTQTQLFNGLLSGTTQVGRYQKKHSNTHTHPDHQTSFVNFLHLLRSIAFFLFISTHCAYPLLPQNLCWNTYNSGKYLLNHGFICKTL